MKNLIKCGSSFALVLALAVVTSICAFATGETNAATADSVMSSLTTGLTEAQGHAFTGINNALPLALAIAGVIIAVNIGYRLFKRMSR